MARKRHSKHAATFKAQVALAALKGDRTVPELAKQFGIHPNLMYKWKGTLLKNADSVFTDGAKIHDEHNDILEDDLYQQIGRLNMEIQWLKKKHDALS